MIASRDIHLWITDREVGTDDFNREILSRYLNIHPRRIHFGRSSNGKPFLKNRQWHSLCFSSSHSYGKRVTAVSLCEQLGVDIEWTARRNALDEIARRYFHPDEVAALTASPTEADRRQLFFRFWTAKEAWIKARGLTIGSASLDQTVFRVAASGIEPLFHIPSHRHWYFSSFQQGEYFISTVQARKCWQSGKPLLQTFQID